MEIKKSDKLCWETRRCLNDAKGAYNSDRYYAPILSDQLYVDAILYVETFVEESKMQEPLPYNMRGGIITFSTDISSTILYNDKIINSLKQKIVTIANRITAMEGIDKVAKNFKLKGWSATKGLHGKYIDRKTGVLFDEKSLSVELMGISTDYLLDVAENLCNDLKQQSVLVKSYENNDIWLIS